jgi:TRAP-type C4-dicarboxylate transport system permease large subunit
VGFFQYLAIRKLDDAINDLVGEGQAGIAQVVGDVVFGAVGGSATFSAALLRS